MCTKDAHKILVKLTTEVTEKLDENASKLVEGLQKIEMDAANYDLRMMPPTRFNVKFLGTETRLAIILTARLIIIHLLIG
jgi:hypothetical protein